MSIVSSIFQSFWLWLLYLSYPLFMSAMGFQRSSPGAVPKALAANATSLMSTFLSPVRSPYTVVRISIFWC